jgi:hypothetical protein
MENGGQPCLHVCQYTAFLLIRGTLRGCVQRLNSQQGPEKVLAATGDVEDRRHYETKFVTRGYTFQQYSTAYRYGEHLAAESHFREGEWTAAVEPEAVGIGKNETRHLERLQGCGAIRVAPSPPKGGPLNGPCETFPSRSCLLELRGEKGYIPSHHDSGCRVRRSVWRPSDRARAKRSQEYCRNPRKRHNP